MVVIDYALANTFVNRICSRKFFCQELELIAKIGLALVFQNQVYFGGNIPKLSIV
jgi:hypothetical protein